MNVGAPLVAYPQTAKLIEPGKRPLHHPAQPSQTTIPLSTTGNKHSYASPPQPTANAFGVIGLIRHHHRRPPPWPPPPLSYRRDGIHQHQGTTGVVPVGGAVSYRQGYSPAVGYQVRFTARPRTDRGIGTRPGPPKTSRPVLVSITARDQSIAPASPRRSSNTRWIFSHTPAFCQSLNPRQHVIPLPQPISCGRYSHGMPVRKTNSIPVRQAQSGTYGRPPFGFGRSGGNDGFMSSHSSSKGAGLALSSSFPLPASAIGQTRPLPQGFVRGSKFARIAFVVVINCEMPQCFLEISNSRVRNFRTVQAQRTQCLEAF